MDLAGGDDGCAVDVAVGFQLCDAAVSDELVGNGEDAYPVDHLRMMFGEVIHDGLAETSYTAAVLYGDDAAVAGGGNVVEQAGVHRLQETHIVYSGRDATVLKLYGGSESVVARVTESDDSHIVAFAQTAALPYLDFAKV